MKIIAFYGYYFQYSPFGGAQTLVIATVLVFKYESSASGPPSLP
jgi:hypothetical protein